MRLQTILLLSIFLMAAACKSITDNNAVSNSSKTRNISNVDISSLGILDMEKILEREDISVLFRDFPIVGTSTLSQDEFSIDSVSVHVSITQKRYLLQLSSKSYPKKNRWILQTVAPKSSEGSFHYLPVRVVGRWDETAEGLMMKKRQSDLSKSIEVSHFFEKTDSLRIVIRNIYSEGLIGDKNSSYTVAKN